MGCYEHRSKREIYTTGAVLIRESQANDISESTHVRRGPTRRAPEFRAIDVIGSHAAGTLPPWRPNIFRRRPRRPLGAGHVFSAGRHFEPDYQGDR